MTSRRTRRSVREIVIFLQALRLARLAQRVRGRASLPELAATMASLPALPHGLDAEFAHRATVRACIRGRRWVGLRDTCLVRSLVVASLLADHDSVLLHVGFASPIAGGGILEGHAWVSVANQVVGGAAAAMTADGTITQLVIPCRRSGGEGAPDRIARAG